MASSTFSVRASPILSENGYPATVYLTTYFAIRRILCNVFFPYLLWKGRGKTGLDLTGVAPGLGRHSACYPASVSSSAIASRSREKENPGNEQLREIARSLATAVAFSIACARIRISRRGGERPRNFFPRTPPS